jgi:hypothetical protein
MKTSEVRFPPGMLSRLSVHHNPIRLLAPAQLSGPLKDTLDRAE